MSIIFKGKNTSGTRKWKVTADTFTELYESLCECGVINECNGSPLEEAKLEKLGKELSDYDFENDEDAYEAYQRDLDSVSLSDNEIMWVIIGEDGEAYYHEFYREVENEDDTTLVEITANDFDENGTYKY